MMMNKIIAFLISLFVLSISVNTKAVNVTGKVELENEVQPSGMQVVFLAVSPTAVTTTVFTQADSTYSATIPPGVYNIQWTKNGYYPYQENSVFFLNDTVLDTHQFEYILGAINLDGYVSGTLYKDSFYLVENMMTVAASDTLIIEAGVKIGFKEDAKMEVYGVLFANGTPEDKILFTTRTYEDNWHSILINSPDSSMIMSHCIFEDAEYGLRSYSSPGLMVEYCDFHNAKSGIDLDTDYYGIVRDCNLYGISKTSSSGVAITGKIGLVENNYISNFNTGISGLGIALIQYNRIEDCRHGIYTVGHNLIPRRKIQYNVINDCDDVGIYVYSRLENTDTVINNTIYQVEGNSLRVLSDGLKNFVSMNIVSDGSIGIRTNTNTNLTYNLVFGNDYDFYATPPGMGQVIGQNSNGDDIDTYLNILNTSPLFAVKDRAHRHYLFLRDDSPCIDVGYPGYLDPDGSSRDLGAHPYLVGVGIEKETDENLMRLYPNPNSGFFTIEFSEISSGTIQVTDLSGRLVFQDHFEFEKMISINTDLNPGLYFLGLKSSEYNYKTEKFIIE